MEIKNQGLNVQVNRMNEGPFPIKQGDVSPIMIKERLTDQEAKVILKGQEVRVKFDGPIPTQDRVMVEVLKPNESGQLVVKPVQNPAPSPVAAKTVDDFLAKAGFDPAGHPELKEAIKLIFSKGGTVSRDTLRILQDFMKNQMGPLSDKLDTIKIMQQKKIEMTKVQLHAVYEALHGKPLTESMSEWISEPIHSVKGEAPKTTEDKPVLEQILSQLKNKTEQSKLVEKVLALLDSTKDQQVISDIKKALQIQQAGKDRILQAITDPEIKNRIQQESNLSTILQLLKTKELPDSLATVIHDAVKLEKIGTAKLETAIENVFTEDQPIEDPLSAKIQEIVKTIQKEPTLEKVLGAIQKALDENTRTDINFSKIKTALEKAAQLTEQGRELAARKELSGAINELVETHPQLQKTDSETALTKAEQYVINDAAQSLQLGSQNILVTKITKEMSQLAIDFKKMRQEMSRNLDAASRHIKSNQAGNVVPAKQMLDATINKLDQAILKGNFMLYTDMAIEKKLLTASSRLAEAKNLLDNGNFAKANEIVKDVKHVLDRLIFKPSESKVMHFVSDQESPTAKSMFEKAIHTGHEQGAREIFEKVKAMGFTHEVDAAKAIVDKQEAPHNVKSQLIQMLGTEDGGQRLPIEQALANITGQQLLNKQDTSGIQNLFLQLPILLNKQVENVKIYVNSQKKGEKIDWENCSLYFVLETKKLGEVGITISAVNRNLSIAFKNDQATFSKKAKPFVEVAKDRLQEIGYHVHSIQFQSFTESVETKKTESTRSTSTYTEKGYDFSI
jgi:HAMP domain-containing protein